MARIAYVNGRYVPLLEAAVNVEDRGYQFSDGVYEVCEVKDGRLVDERRHLARLVYSLTELRIAMPMAMSALSLVMREVVRRNRVRCGILYLQVNEGVAVITIPDNRWGRVDIKSVSLLPNVLAKQAAREAGAREAWFVDVQGKVTEGSSSNAWIVTRDGRVVTRPLGHDILRGITRTVLLEVIAAQGLALEERPFSLEEAYAAREAFLTSASQVVIPVVRIDGRPIGNGAPGLIAAALRRDFHRFAEIS